MKCLNEKGCVECVSVCSGQIEVDGLDSTHHRQDLPLHKLGEDGYRAIQASQV